MLKNLLKVEGAFFTVTRSLTNHKHNKKFMYDNGELFGKVYYFPRKPNHKDPPIEPAKLFRVERILPIKGTPHWERRILRAYRLLERSTTVVKNIPEECARLWKIKHLVIITPITFPKGEPKLEDVDRIFLKENGECIVDSKVKVSDERLKATEEFKNDPKKLDPQTMKAELRARWQSGWST